MLFVINIPSVIVMLSTCLIGLDNKIEQYHWTQYKTLIIQKYFANRIIFEIEKLAR